MSGVEIALLVASCVLVLAAGVIFVGGYITYRMAFYNNPKKNKIDPYTYIKDKYELLMSMSHLKLHNFSKKASKGSKEGFNRLAHNDFAFIRAINSGMSVEQAKGLYAEIYPDKPDKFVNIEKISDLELPNLKEKINNCKRLNTKTHMCNNCARSLYDNNILVCDFKHEEVNVTDYCVHYI